VGSPDQDAYDRGQPGERDDTADHKYTPGGRASAAMLPVGLRRSETLGERAPA
jgi:hypothetical protein